MKYCFVVSGFSLELRWLEEKQIFSSELRFNRYKSKKTLISKGFYKGNIAKVYFRAITKDNSFSLTLGINQ